jgi:hypothetical protein
MTANRRAPLVPEDRTRAPTGRASLTSLARACIAKAIGKIERRDDAAILRDRWPDDRAASLVLRAPTTPSSLTNSSALGATVVADLIAVIGQVGAGARLLRAGLQFVFDNAATLSVPALQASASEASFVQEGAPIPVHNLVSSAVSLVPRKLSSISVLSAEMLASGNAEGFVTAALTQSVGLALDAALFDSAAADAVRPAGLRHNIAALTPSSASDPHTAMVADAVALAGAVSVIGSPIVFIAAPPRAVALSLQSYNAFPFTVLASPALAANDLIAVAANGIASAADATPEIEASKFATVHMEDVPLPIGSSGSPNTVAAPTRSLWQTDTVGLKIRFSVDWALRDQRALAWLTATGW